MKPQGIWQRACCDCNPSMRTLTSCVSAIYCKIHCIRSTGRCGHGVFAEVGPATPPLCYVLFHWCQVINVFYSFITLSEKLRHNAEFPLLFFLIFILNTKIFCSCYKQTADKVRKLYKNSNMTQSFEHEAFWED